MAQKRSVPFELCLEMLQCMLAARPGGRWFMTLFGGQGSFDRACRMLGLVHVSVSFDRPSAMNEDIEGCVVISKSDMYSKFTHLCEYIGLHYEEPKRAFSQMSVPEVREDDTAIIEFLEYHDVKYDIVEDAHPLDIPTLLYDMSYYTARS